LAFDFSWCGSDEARANDVWTYDLRGTYHLWLTVFKIFFFPISFSAISSDLSTHYFSLLIYIGGGGGWVEAQLDFFLLFSL